MARGIELAAEGRDFTLSGTDVPDDVFRSACVVLAGQALKAAGDDWDAAKAMLCPVLEAVGAVPYDPGGTRGPWARQYRPQERPS